LLRQSRPLRIGNWDPPQEQQAAFEQARARDLQAEPLVLPFQSSEPDRSKPLSIPPVASDFRLHGRTLCRLRADGLKELEHRWPTWPEAKAYRLLSDEPEGFGGRGLAPDATTYMAAGLALSLMTELARHGGSERESCDRFAMRVDAHFPFGGLVQPGIENADMDPLEVAATLGTDSDPEHCSRLSAQIERTSLARAVCGDKLSTNIRIRLI
jgi:hypothetical protein